MLVLDNRSPAPPPPPPTPDQALDRPQGPADWGVQGPSGLGAGGQWPDSPPPPNPSLAHGPEPSTSLLGPVGLWINESFRIVTDRAGHLLPFALFGVLVPGLAASVALWFANRNTTFVVNAGDDSTDLLIERGYEGSLVPVFATVAAVAVLMLTGVVVKAAAVRQVWSATADQPETWTASLAALGRRWRSLLWVAIVRVGFVSVVAGVAVLSWNILPENGLAIMAVVGPGLILFTWWRFSLFAQAAVLGPPGTKPLATGWQLSGRDPIAVFGRLLMLALVASSFFLMFRFIGNLAVALTGAGPTDEERSPLGDAGLATFALARAFGLFGLGAAAFQMLTASGLTLLYLRLNGPVDDTELASASDGDDRDLDEVDLDRAVPGWGGDLDA